MKSIIVNSYYFYPKNTPRAFRTFELVKKLAEKNRITLILPSEYKTKEKEIYSLIPNNLKIIYCGVCKNINNNINNNVVKRKSFFKRLLVAAFKYLFIDKHFMYIFDNYKELKKIALNSERYDSIISIGLPVYIHFGTYGFIKKINYKIKSVADYGDPFSTNPSIKVAPYYRYIEKKILASFDFITIPTEKSKIYYLDIINQNKIKIIPQGFDLESVKLAKYKENDIPTFAYAGIFYNKIRNPILFFEELAKIDFDFKFIVFTDFKNTETMAILEKCSNKLKGKVVINDLLPRNECIYELSKMDFLVDIQNDSSQIPSKLIDYAIAKRPILTVNSICENSEIKSFLSKDFSSKKDINLKNYDINNICEKFESIL